MVLQIGQTCREEVEVDRALARRWGGCATPTSAAAPWVGWLVGIKSIVIVVFTIFIGNNSLIGISVINDNNNMIIRYYFIIIIWYLYLVLLLFSWIYYYHYYFITVIIIIYYKHHQNKNQHFHYHHRHLHYINQFYKYHLLCYLYHPYYQYAFYH